MRNKSIDSLKAIAIISVVFYHLKVMTYGFLGVDIFFVIAGYLTTRSIQKLIGNDTFSYIKFVSDRIKRLMPLILAVGTVCLIIGVVGMLPDDFENMSSTIIASNFMSNNVLAAITTKNYWDVVNDYKPLMHLWYVGVLFEFYLVYPLIILIISKVSEKNNPKNIKLYKRGILSLTFISVILYLYPGFGAAQKFYFLPFRFFEFGIGAGILYFEEKLKKLFKNSIWNAIFCIGLLILLCWKTDIIPASFRLIVVVCFAALFIVSNPFNQKIIENRFLVAIGQRSYSIFIWHQMLLAFYRYYFTNQYGVLFIILYWIAVLLISELSYNLIEQKIQKYKTKVVIAFCIIAFLLSTGTSLLIYVHAGVVRDVPELGIYKDNVHRGMHKEYCDRVYSYNHDFANDGRIKVFVTGWSFARDFANMILESKYGEYVDLSYALTYTSDYDVRIQEADYIFVYGNKNNYSGKLFEVGNGEYWGIGPKNFGESNGIIYKNRFSENYFDQTIVINDSFINENKEDKEQWGDHYINMIDLVQNSDGSIPIFTDDNMFISQDCRHLTEAGAKYYAKLVDWDSIFDEGIK